MKELYIIEGTSNSGKTTTANLIKEKTDSILINEFMENPNSPKPSNNLIEEISNQKKFLLMEKERLEIAKKYLDGNIVFLDRSFISILAVSYAFEKIGKYSAYEYALNLYKTIQHEDWYIPPKRVYILTANYRDKLKRNVERIKKIKENWIQEKFDYYQNEFYYNCDVIDNKYFIDNTGLPKEYAAMEIIKQIKKERKY